MFCTKPTSCAPPPNPLSFHWLSLRLIHTQDVFLRIAKNEGVLSLWKGFAPYYVRIGSHTVITFILLEQLKNMYLKRFMQWEDPTPLHPTTCANLCHTALCGCYFYSKSRLIVKLIINHQIIIIYSNCTSSLTGSLSTQYNSTYSHSDLLITSLLVLAFIAHIPFIPA